jgi:hypothetical protein
MKILKYENKTKTHRIIETVSTENLIERLNRDEGLLEVISIHDSNTNVRLFFDIDCYDKTNDPLQNVLHILNTYFKCETHDWAICSSNRTDKFSYHIVSKKLATTIKNLRIITKELAYKLNVFDDRMLYCSITDEFESIYFRLPNQSKKTINKQAPPLSVIQGHIEDFFITNMHNLIYI